MILHCARQNQTSNKTSADEVVMVERDEIVEFYDKVKLLEGNFEMLQSATQIKL
jgi:hypothetical protein